MSVHWLLLIRRLDAGGAQRQVVALAQALAVEGHKVTVAVYYPGGDLARALVAEGDVQVVSLTQNTGVLAPIVIVWNLVKLLHRSRVNVFYAFLPSSTVISALIKPFLPRRCILVWGIRAADMPLSEYSRKARLVYALQNRLWRSADCIFTNSKRARTVFIEQAGPQSRHRVFETNNILDTKEFSPSLERRRCYRQKHDIPRDATVVGFVGRLDPVKDPSLFLRASAYLLERFADVQILMVVPGNAEQTDALQSEIESLRLTSHIRCLDGESDMASYYNAIDLLILTSASESSPNVVLEAMACGRPIVASNVGDVASRLAGGGGIVVQERDPKAFAEAAATLLTDPDRSSNRALDHVRHVASGESVVRAMVDRLLGVGLSASMEDGQ